MPETDPDLSPEAYRVYRDGLRASSLPKQKPKLKLWRILVYVALAVAASFVVTIASYGLRELFK